MRSGGPGFPTVGRRTLKNDRRRSKQLHRWSDAQRKVFDAVRHHGGDVNVAAWTLRMPIKKVKRLMRCANRKLRLFNTNNAQHRRDRMP